MKLKDYINGENFELNLLENDIEFHKHFLTIDEMFDKNIKLETPTWDGKYFTVNFKVNSDKIYIFKAKENEPGIFGIQFFTTGLDGTETQKNKNYTGSVFSGVIKSLELLIKRKEVSSFFFNTKELKLISLYDKLIRRIEKHLKNYKFTQSIRKEGRKLWMFERIKKQ